MNLFKLAMKKNYFATNLTAVEQAPSSSKVNLPSFTKS